MANTNYKGLLVVGLFKVVDSSGQWCGNHWCEYGCCEHGLCCKEDKSMSNAERYGLVFGIVAGVLLLIGVIVGLTIWYCRRKSQRTSEYRAKHMVPTEQRVHKHSGYRSSRGSAVVYKADYEDDDEPY